jgi:putative redox protein
MTTTDSEVIRVAETGRGKYQVEAKAGDSTLVIDEPVSAGGLGAGPNPYNLLSAALGACTTMTIRLYAERKKWPLKHVEIAVRHSRAGLEARDRFDLDIELQGDLDDAQRARLMDIAERCPVHLTLARGSQVQANLSPPAPMPAPQGGGNHVACMVEACEQTG